MPASTPIYGLPYPLDTDPVPVAPQNIQDLALTVEGIFDTVVGMRRVIPSPSGHTNITFNSRGVGTPSTGVSTFTVNNVFTTEFRTYRLIWNGGISNSASTNVRLSYPNVTTGYYGALFGRRPNGGVNTSFADNNTSVHTYAGSFNSTLNVAAEIINPAFTGAPTAIINRWFEPSAPSAGLQGDYIGYILNTSAVSSFTLLLSVGTISTAGTLHIYGYSR